MMPIKGFPMLCSRQLREDWPQKGNTFLVLVIIGPGLGNVASRHEICVDSAQTTLWVMGRKACGPESLGFPFCG
jgi:hypothetical protein